MLIFHLAYLLLDVLGAFPFLVKKFINVESSILVLQNIVLLWKIVWFTIRATRFCLIIIEISLICPILWVLRLLDFNVHVIGKVLWVILFSFKSLMIWSFVVFNIYSILFFLRGLNIRFIVIWFVILSIWCFEKVLIYIRWFKKVWGAFLIKV